MSMRSGPKLLPNCLQALSESVESKANWRQITLKWLDCKWEKSNEQITYRLPLALTRISFSMPRCIHSPSLRRPYFPLNITVPVLSCNRVAVAQLFWVVRLAIETVSHKWHPPASSRSGECVILAAHLWFSLPGFYHSVTRFPSKITLMSKHMARASTHSTGSACLIAY